MQRWLRDRQKPVQEATPGGMKMTMDGMEHVMLMPGMLTEDQMKQLDAARGTDFDRLFLTFMMQHHRGAVSMVKDLFATYGAGQDETVFKFASDVNVDQTTEIARMEKLLTQLTTVSTSDLPALKKVVDDIQSLVVKDIPMWFYSRYTLYELWKSNVHVDKNTAFSDGLLPYDQIWMS